MQKTINTSSILSYLVATLAMLFFASLSTTTGSPIFKSVNEIYSAATHLPISSKKNHFCVAKKQNLFSDTIPLIKRNLTDTVPSQLRPVFNERDTIVVTDTLRIPADSVATDSTESRDTIPYRLAPNALEAPVTYTAEDSMVIRVPEKTVTLYGKKVVTNYKDNELAAPVISFDQASGDIIASITRDSTGKPVSLPTFTQADFISQSDSIRFNMQSGKGLTKSTYTQQGEMYVYGEVIKKVSEDVFYALRGRFTTCNLDTPHFAFISNKIKFINNKVAISGPVHPEFEGIPIPLYFPFGIYPLSQGRHSGLLAPNFTTNEQRGVGLEGLGYYKVISDNWDVIVRTSIYSYGGWSVNVNPRYSKRYHYNGNLSFDIQHFNLNFKGDPDFRKNRSYRINWSHSADTKARPGLSFRASVNAGSSSYNATVPNDPRLNFANQLQSSIAYSKSWKGKPFNLTLAANHDQNANLSLINISLPSVGFNVSTVYPFRKKEFAGTPKWYENIGIGYVGTAQNRFSFYDEDTITRKSIFRQIADTVQWGAHHSVPISLSLPQIGIFQVSPGVTYDETWFQKKTTRYWDDDRDTLLTDVRSGFFTARQMSFSLNLSTRIFGMFIPKKKDAKINAIRHELRPTIGINYRPDFNKNNYYYAIIDTNGTRRKYSYYETANNIYSPYSTGTFGGFNFGLENNISMKVRNRKDTGENALKKVPILDRLSMQGSYNFFIDSFKLSPISLSASTNLFEKINITAYASLDPYEYNGEGRRIDQLIWKRKPISLGRLSSGNISLSTQLQGGNKATGKDAGLQPGNSYIPNNDYTMDEYDTEMAYMQNHPGEFADFNIPWSVNFTYALQYSTSFNKLKTRFEKTYSQNISFGGTLNLTPKWQMGVNGYYNVTLGQINPLSLSISRDLHCWQMSIAISPIGNYRYFSINISPKSPLLRDLKINRTRSFASGAGF